MRKALLLALMLLPFTGQAAEDCAALRAEVEALKLQVLQLQNAQAAAALAPKPLPQVAATVAAAADNVPASTNQRTLKVVTEEAYTRTGCRKGLFTGAPPGKWQEREAWDNLEKGMSPRQVEDLLGVEHYNLGDGRNVKWEYGKCEAFVSAAVLFVDGQLSDWRAPQF